MHDPSPSTLLDDSDPGDDVIARFRYQFCNVAINALRLVSNPDWAKSVICENFEDLILERHDGNFVAIQVKTKARHLPPMKLTEEAVEKSIVRFVKLDKQFPGKVIEFQFVTNHEMWTDRDDQANLVWLLEGVNAAATISRLRKTNPKKIAIERLCEVAEATPDEVISTLLRTKCSARKEDVKSIEKAVEHAVGECGQCAEVQYATVVRLAEDLIAEASTASTKGRKTLVPILYAADANFVEVFSEVSLLGKQIDRQRVEQIIADRLAPTDEPLMIGSIVTLKDLPNGLPRMVEKMAAGGVQASRINHTQDLVRSFESLEIKWAIKNGPKKARMMVSDLLARTLTDCIEAEVEAASAASVYGSQQYSVLKRMLEERYSRERDTLYGCKPDHLIGAAGVLTEACKVWWSDRFELLEESQ